MGLVEAILGRLFPPRVEPIAGARRGWRIYARGRVIGRDLLDAPLAGDRCVYYHYVVETWSRSTASWLVVERDEAIAEFYLQDESGRAVIAPERAVVETTPGGGDTRELGPGRRAREVRIGHGDLVEVQGMLEEDEVEDLYDGERGYREDPVRLLIRAVDGGSLRIRLL
jgi:hypothetical protein